jgi:hypothetical protein
MFFLGKTGNLGVIMNVCFSHGPKMQSDRCGVGVDLKGVFSPVATSSGLSA